MASPYSDSVSRSFPTDPRARAKRGTPSPLSRSAASSPSPQNPQRALSPLSKKIQELKAKKGAGGQSSSLGILQEKQRSQIHLLLEGVDTTHLPQFSKRLGKSEEKEMVDRISQRKRKVPKLLQQAELARLEQSERKQEKLFQEFKNKRPVDEDEIDGFLKRMNEKEEKRKSKLKELQEPKELPPVVLSADQLADFTERMHNAEMERRAEAQEELLTSAYPEEEEPRTIGGEELEESLNRIYHDPMAASADRKKRLEEKYVFQRKTAKRLDDAAIRELADKLSKPKSKEVSTKNPYFGATHLS